MIASGARYAILCGVLIAVLALAFGASADPIADFYKGRQMTLIVATPAGGPYDNVGRLLARYLPDHIPGNPSIAVENMPGATGMLAANYVYNRAPQDGTVLGNLHNSLALAKAVGQLKANLDPASFNWIGNPTREVGDVIVSDRSPVKTIEDAKRIEVIMGAASQMGASALYPRVMNHVLGTKFRIVLGYEGFAGVQHAIDQGEVDGTAGDTWYSGSGRNFEMYQAGTIHVLVQIGTKSPDLAGIPLLVDLAGNEADRELLALFSSPYTLGKPTVVGPKVPPERVAALRAAYLATMADPAFLADARRMGISIDPVSGAELAALAKRLTALPDALIQRARAVIQQ
jgi:tripartite-type tricarboxylate transporter receptor subunit TctC